MLEVGRMYRIHAVEISFTGTNWDSNVFQHNKAHIKKVSLGETWFIKDGVEELEKPAQSLNLNFGVNLNSEEIPGFLIQHQYV